MKLLRNQWPLILILAILAIVGVGLVARSSFSEIRVNLGCTLLGTVVSVLLFDFVVTRYIERREELRRRPILRTIAKQLQVLVDRMRGEFRYIGIEIDGPMKSGRELGEQLDADRFNERIEKLPGYFISRVIAFTSENSFSRACLRNLYDLTRADLPPELASAILAIVAHDAWYWQPIAMNDTNVDRKWIDERQDFLYEYLMTIKRLDHELKRLKADVA